MQLTEEQTLIRETARAFASEQLAPKAADWDREARFPKEAIAEMGRLGFLGMVVPEEWDGAGADHVSYALTMIEVAAGDGACSTIMSVHNSVACMPILKHGSDRAEGALPEALGQRPAAWRLLPHRAPGRLGRGGARRPRPRSAATTMC